MTASTSVAPLYGSVTSSFPEDAIEELIALCPEEGVRDLERICRKMCESVISLYYVEGNIIKNIKAENLAKIMGPIYYR